VDQGVGIVVPR